MKKATDRRDFLRTVLGGAAGFALAGGGLQTAMAKTKSAPLTAVPLTDRIVQITGAGGNVVVFKGPEGLLMVDGGSPEHAAELQKFVARQFDKQPVRVLFNTHWHSEHTGSNERFAKAGARIIAHENTRLWLGAEVKLDWQGDKVYPPRPREAWPTETIYTSATMTAGDEQIEYAQLFQAHTDGDIYVYFRNQNVLVAGDVLSAGGYPILDCCTGGWIGGMINANKKLLDVTDDQTRIVPGTGPVQTRADLQAQHDMLVEMRKRLSDLMRKGYGRDDMIAARPTGEFDAKWGDPTMFVSNAYKGMWGHVRELGGIV